MILATLAVIQGDSPRVHASILLVRISIGVVMVLFGLSQFFKPGKWLGYIPKWVEAMLPMKPETTMRLHSFGNFFFGLLFLLGLWPVVMAWITAIWWFSILPFAVRYDRFIALRDAAIICAIIAVILLLTA